jgi:hypothetical protein
MFVMQGIFNLSNVGGKTGCFFNQITIQFRLSDLFVQFAFVEAYCRIALSVAQLRQRDQTMHTVPFCYIVGYCRL